MYEHLHYEIGMFQRATQRNTIARQYTGAAVVSTITSILM